MNPIQFYYAISMYANTTQHSRYYFQEVNKAMNDSIMKKVDSITDTAKVNEMNGIDRVQKFRDELYTLIKSSVSVPTTITTINGEVTINHINFPVDYQTFAGLSVVIDGSQRFSRDTTYNEIGPMLQCSYRKPNNKKTYYLEDSTGLKIYRGITGAITSAELTYIKQPQTFYMGNETDEIDPGPTVLALNTNYTAIEESVYNGVTYIPGSSFTTNGVLQALASGQVILSSILVNTDLPEKCHDELAKMASEILLGVNSDFDNAAFAEKESK